MCCRSGRAMDNDILDYLFVMFSRKRRLGRVIHAWRCPCGKSQCGFAFFTCISPWALGFALSHVVCTELSIVNMRLHSRVVPVLNEKKNRLGWFSHMGVCLCGETPHGHVVS